MGLSRRDLIKKAGMVAVGTGFAALPPSLNEECTGRKALANSY